MSRCQTRQEGHGTALGEATENDALGRDAGVDLFLDEFVKVLLATLDAFSVLVGDDSIDIPAKGFLLEVREMLSRDMMTYNVKPSRHPHSHVLLFCQFGQSQSEEGKNSRH